MVMWGLPKEALDDPFQPPSDACRVRCIHCGQEYSSDEIVWRPTADGGFWCCPVTGCGGMGFMFDIFPVDEFGGPFDEEEDEDDYDCDPEEEFLEDTCEDFCDGDEYDGDEYGEEEPPW